MTLRELLVILESYRAKHWILEGELTYNTITQAVELLEDVECSCWYIPPYQRCKQCDARQAFLARYAVEKEISK